MSSNQRASLGFTIIELMIAISILSMVLLLTTVGIVRIGAGYYRGITQANTQQAARTVIDDIAQNIQFGGFTGINANTAPGYGVGGYGIGTYYTRSYCIGMQRFSYVMGYQEAATTNVPNLTSKHVLWEDTLPPNNSCAALNTGEDPVQMTSAAGSIGGVAGSGVELIGNNMRLTNFTITQVPNTQLYTIPVTVMYGADDLIDKSSVLMANWKCKPSSGLVGAAFCAKSALTTTVGKRLS